MKAYFISGLGADKRVFKYISLPQEFEVIYLDWIKPLKNESLREYAWRLGEKIDNSTPFVIIGLSMGGMIASEISIQKNYPVRTVIISSVPVASHLPSYMKASGKLNLHKLIPLGLLKSASIIKLFFTTETNEDKQILKQMIEESDPEFIRWAIHAIATWKNNKPPISYVHIHGTEDKILPIYFTKPTHVIAKAGHTMIINRAEEINEILEKTLSGI